MTSPIRDVVREVPEQLGYRPTTTIAWVVKPRADVFGDDQTLLAQLWKSIYRSVEGIWVVVPTFTIEAP